MDRRDRGLAILTDPAIYPSWMENTLLLESMPLVTVSVFLILPDGSKLTEFTLERKPVAMTKSIVRRYKDTELNNMRQDAEHQQEIQQGRIKELEKASFDHLFNDYLPLYQELLTDEEGNFLIFRTDDCFSGCPILIEVYSPKGEFVCEMEIKTGEYNLIIDSRRKHMCFTKEGLIALVQPKISAADFHLKMIKVGKDA